MDQQIVQQVTQLAQHLIVRNWTVTCAESCTGGGLASAFTSLSGSSAWFQQGWVTYSNQAKHELVDVPLSILQTHGAVSAQTVESMACGAATKARADLSIAISGIAGPGGGSTEKPVGLVWFGLCKQDLCSSEKKCFSGDRTEIRNGAILHGLKILNQSLVENRV